MSVVTKDTVLKIANLAKLELTDEEVNQFASQFTAILEQFEKLSKLDTSGVVPMVTPTPIEAVNREDLVHEGLGADKALANAPEKLGNLFKVPPVVG